jgi:hypothetical protein
MSQDTGSQERYREPIGTGYHAAEEATHNGVPYEPVAEKPRLPSLDLEPPAAPDFSPDDWLANDNHTGSLADHPLLRGLLLELPPRGSLPPPGWLDRWFEATRSILELLYVDENTR